MKGTGKRSSELGNVYSSRSRTSNSRSGLHSDPDTRSRGSEYFNVVPSKALDKWSGIRLALSSIQQGSPVVVYQEQQVVHWGQAPTLQDGDDVRSVANSNVTGFRKTLGVEGLLGRRYFSDGRSKHDRRPEYVGRLPTVEEVGCYSDGADDNDNTITQKIRLRRSLRVVHVPAVYSSSSTDREPHSPGGPVNQSKQIIVSTAGAMQRQQTPCLPM